MPQRSKKKITKSSKSTKIAGESKSSKSGKRTIINQLGLKGGEQPQVMLGGTNPPLELACRAKSNLAIYPNIFSDEGFEIDPEDGNIWIGLTLNSNHQIFTTAPRSCPNSFEGLGFLAQSSSNICAISDFFYFGNPITFIAVKVAPCSLTAPLTLGFRIKFEQNFNITRRENPRKKDGTATFGNGQISLKG
ncbi:MAG TPA: hypothetical protein VK582_07530 [Pyrinomonadaceae bacterium]|nr:hypothetical protein [Pyrinomonadaceae bacterium]